MDAIIGVSKLTNGYWVTFVRADGFIYSERWPSIPAGWENKVDGYQK